MRGLSASLVANALTGALLVAACAAPPNATTAAPVGTTPAVSGQGVPVALPSGVDSLLRHADSVLLRAPDSSTAFFQIALDRATASRDSAGIARSLTGLGQAARHAGDFSASRELSERALALKLRLGMRADLFRSYNALGLLAFDEERLSDASANVFESG